MTYCVLLAGGVGQRVGAGIPKQFIEVEGRRIIAYTLDVFERHPDIDRIVVVCHPAWRDVLDGLVAREGFRKVFRVVDGGCDFQHSMINGMEALDGVAADDDVVLTHWAASPFVSDEVIADNVRVCREKGNAMSACPFFLIVGSNDGDRSTKWVDRDSIMQLNAPQSFRFALLRDFYRRALAEGLLEQVEPHTTTLMYRMGIPIYFSKGNQANVKITTPEDVEMFRAFVLMKRLRAEGGTPA